MAIAYVGGSTGPNDHALSTTLTLPTGLVAGDVTIAAFILDPGAAPQAITAPAGWTVVPTMNQPDVLVCYRVYQAGDPASITASTTAIAWWESACVVYSGVDTTTPIDVSNCCALITSNQAAIESPLYRAPSVNPNWNGDQLVVLYLQSFDGGGSAITNLPSGLTLRKETTAGPSIAIYDKALSTAAGTGNQDISWNSTLLLQFGAQIALKAAGATAATPAAPNITFGGMQNGALSVAATSAVIDFTQNNAQPGDLIVIGMQVVSNTNVPAASVTPPSGYTQQVFNTGAGVWTHHYASGDPTAVTFTFPATSYVSYVVAILRKSGTGTATVVVDTSGIASANPTASTPSLTPASTGEMLLTFFSGANESAGAFSPQPTGLTIDFNDTFGPSMLFAWVEPVSSPTGSFSAGTTSYTAVGAALLAALSGGGGGGTSLALTGVSATGAVGTVGPAVSAALSGASAAGAVGSVSDGEVPLSGVSATGGVGTLVAVMSASLSQVSATGGIGAVGVTISAALTGENATGSTGSVSVAGDRSAALTGVAASGVAGAPTPSVVLTLAGVAGTSEAGDVVVFQPAQALTGVAAESAAGTVVPSQATGGVAAAAAAGTVAPGQLLKLSGNTLSGASGTLSPASTLPLTGVLIAGDVGAAGASITLSLSGNDATVGVGALGSGFHITPSGATALAQAGQIASGTTLGTTGVSATGLAELTGVATPLSSVGAAGVAGVIGIDLSVGVTGCTAVGLTGFLSQPLGGNQSHVFILTYDHERTVRIPSG
jgi:hypothetical protein